jgi:hypothetical protein
MTAARSRSLAAAYVFEPALQRQANAAGANYWYCYIREVCDRLGLSARQISPAQVAAGELADLGTLFLGDFPAGLLDAAAITGLERWVSSGGILIGFGTQGLDRLFGVRQRSIIPQPGDAFTISGTFALATGHPVTEGIHSPLHPQQRLLIVSPIRAVEPLDGTETLGHLFNVYGSDLGCAAVSLCRIGAGSAFYCAFNLTQTLWAIQQGRPIVGDYDGDGYYRVSDARIIGTNEPEVAYTDELLFLVQNMVGRQPIPLIHQLPPLQGTVPDALFFWGGDDEGAAGAALFASNWMREQGLPYHVNVMPRRGAFVVSPQEFAAIKANGHECALHYNFIDDFTHPNAFTEADVRTQADLYAATYGERPLCTVNHWCCWTGWAEPARWMAAAGGKADNCRIHRGSPPLNPANMLGFSFGTAFPFYIYDDAAHGNARLDFLCEPVTAYETGYTPEATDFSVLHRSIDLAARYHLTMNLFYHPPCVRDFATCRAAIQEALRYLKEKGIKAVHMGNDALWAWWSARSAARLSDVALDGAMLRFRSACRFDAGSIVKVPLGSGGHVRAATCDGHPAVAEEREEFGQPWAFIVLPPGEHEVQVELMGASRA